MIPVDNYLNPVKLNIAELSIQYLISHAKIQSKEIIKSKIEVDNLHFQISNIKYQILNEHGNSY